MKHGKHYNRAGENKIMVVELISVGKELLRGNIVNNNAAYLAKRCADLGLFCHYQVVVGENEEHLTEAMNAAITRSQIIILAGGIGQAVDDWKQSFVPEQAIVIENENKKAPGFIFEKDGRQIIFLPGQPDELEPMFENSVAPFLAGKSTEVTDTQNDIIYKDTLEKTVVDLLTANKLSVTTAESCTGGLVAARIINVSGVSEVYKSGYITYSNKAKTNILGVKESLLDEKGAVSEEAAREMAKGAAAVSEAEVAVAVTGIAGPGGGTEEKPVGLVYIACSVCGKITVEKHYFSGNREKIRETAVSSALVLMRQCILQYYK